MFRNRISSQKPGDDFIANFRQSFPEVGAATSSAGNRSGSHSLDVTAMSAQHSERNQTLGNEALKDLDPTPRLQNDQFRFTPSLLDPDSLAFSAFANQPPGYYTPTPGGTHTLYHPQAGDLHTPSLGLGMGLGMGLGTPLSLPTSADGLHVSTLMDMSVLGHQMPAQFHNYNPFAPAHTHQSHPQDQHEHQQPQSSFAPSSFVHQDTGYETMDHDGSPPTDDDGGCLSSLDATLQHQSPVMTFQPNLAITVPPHSAEKFRFHVVLNAPTAMIKHAEEIPVTYLNKGQAYSVSIVDTERSTPLPAGSRFRTFMRISFEDEQQRQRPATCWQLWKEGRGTNEAHQRGGKLQAVEYVEASQPAESEDKRTRVELDSASFDGFSVIWSPGVNGSPDCNLAVRFNFLSTDFSHSKGVKGIPVRLCAKTQLLSTGSPRSITEYSEVSYCKVKLFRDHGAERKLSNDIAHVKKTIDKLKQQIAQAESGLKDVGKKKRTASVAKAQPSQRPGKVSKHKRTWSMSSTSDGGGGRLPIEDDIHYRLQTMQDMFTSTRPASIFFLRGSELDDPDLRPVALPGQPLDLTKVDSREAPIWQQRRSIQSITSIASPSPSHMSIQSQLLSATSTNPPAPWSEFSALPRKDAAKPFSASAEDRITNVPKKDGTRGQDEWIEALEVDPNYQPPPEQPIRPVACFYILRRDGTITINTEYYRAVYLMQRTLHDFHDKVAAKWNLEPTRILRTLHVIDRGLEVEVDDDVIRELAEGQDVILEISKLQNPDMSPLKREWDLPIDVALDSESAGATHKTPHTSGYELRLFF